MFVLIFSDEENLIVPYSGTTEYMLVVLFQLQPATLPCKPTSSLAKASLWKIHTNSGEPEEIKVDSNLGVTYDPRAGFYFEHPRWNAETQILECRISVGNQEATSIINVVWSSKKIHC